MNYTQEEITKLVVDKCREAFVPLYAQIEELKAKYYPTLAKAEPTPQPNPEEVEEAELEEKRKEWKKIAEEMRAKGNH